MSFQLIEVADAIANILCPHCHHAVLDWNQEQYIQPCEHTCLWQWIWVFNLLQIVLKRFYLNLSMRYMKILI